MRLLLALLLTTPLFSQPPDLDGVAVGVTIVLPVPIVGIVFYGPADPQPDLSAGYTMTDEQPQDDPPLVPSILEETPLPEIMAELEKRFPMGFVFQGAKEDHVYQHCHGVQPMIVGLLQLALNRESPPQIMIHEDDLIDQEEDDDDEQRT